MFQIINSIELKIENLIKQFQKIIKNIRFKHKNELFFYINFENEIEKLYILTFLKKKVFEITHDRHYYKEFHRTYH